MNSEISMVKHNETGQIRNSCLGVAKMSEKRTSVPDDRK